jgi:hypothetical protein
LLLFISFIMHIGLFHSRWCDSTMYCEIIAFAGA